MISLKKSSKYDYDSDEKYRKRRKKYSRDYSSDSEPIYKSKKSSSRPKQYYSSDDDILHSKREVTRSSSSDDIAKNYPVALTSRRRSNHDRRDEEFKITTRRDKSHKHKRDKSGKSPKIYVSLPLDD